MSNNYKKICFLTLVLTFIFGMTFAFSYSNNLVTDAGNHTSHSSSSSSSSSSHSSSSSSSSHSSSSSSSYSSGGSYNYGDGVPLKEMSLKMSIGLFLFVSIHYNVFAFASLSYLLFPKIKFIYKMLMFNVIRILVFIILSIVLYPGIASVIDFIALFFIAFPAFFIAIAKGTKNILTNNKNIQSSINYKELDISELQKYGISNIDELKNELYNMFYDIEIAWMNFDYDKLKELCSDELYNTYKSQLKAYEIKNEKNIMENITKINVIPYKIAVNNNVITLNSIIEIEMKDYIINVKTNEITSGNKDTIYNNTYNFTFIKNIKNRVDKCPGCGEDMTKYTGTTTCPYCHTILINFDDKWHVSEKELLNQINK